MDETNPTDITANPAGTNPVPASQTAPPAGGAVLIHPESLPLIQADQPVQAVPPPVPVPAPVPTPTPVQQVPPPVQNMPAEAGVAPVTTVAPAPQAEPAQPAKPIREDIARVINKIKLPERITLRMSGEKAKPPTPTPPPAPPAPEKVPEAGTPPPAGEAPAQAPRQNADAPKPKEEKSSVTSFHTLKDDLQNVVRNKKMSLVRAVALESEKRRGQEHLTSPGTSSDTARSRNMTGIVLVVALLLMLALGAFFGVKFFLQKDTSSTLPAAAPALMFAEKTVAFPQETRTGIDLRRTLIAGARRIPGTSLGAVIHIVPTSVHTDEAGASAEQPQNIGEFLTAMEAQATPELIRSFRGDFFLGLHQTVGKLAPVIVIPVTSYERAFAGMLAWEPSINTDLSPVFTSVSPQTMNESGLFVERQFQDTLINNYDVRVLKDDAGAIQMLYSFPTRTMLIIAESPYSFTETLSRLRASRQL